MKIHTNTIALTLIALAIFWHSENNKYAIERMDSNSFIKLNTRTGIIEDYCYIQDPIGCQKWDIAWKKAEEEMDKYIEESYKRAEEDFNLKKKAGVESPYEGD